MIKTGDKVKLINVEGINPLHKVKLGGIYEVFSLYKDNIEIIRENGTIFGYKKERFEKVGESSSDNKEEI